MAALVGLCETPYPLLLMVRVVLELRLADPTPAVDGRTEDELELAGFFVLLDTRDVRPCEV